MRSEQSPNHRAVTSQSGLHLVAIEGRPADQTHRCKSTRARQSIKKWREDKAEYLRTDSSNMLNQCHPHTFHTSRGW